MRLTLSPAVYHPREGTSQKRVILEIYDGNFSIRIEIYSKLAYWLSGWINSTWRRHSCGCLGPWILPASWTAPRNQLSENAVPKVMAIAGKNIAHLLLIKPLHSKPVFSFKQNLSTMKGKVNFNSSSVRGQRQSWVIISKACCPKKGNRWSTIWDLQRTFWPWLHLNFQAVSPR